MVKKSDKNLRDSKNKNPSIKKEVFLHEVHEEGHHKVNYDDIEEKIIRDLDFIYELLDGSSIDDYGDIYEEKTDMDNFIDSYGEIDMDKWNKATEELNIEWPINRLKTFSQSSDENFKKFTDIYNAYIASKTVELEVAPDSLKDDILGIEEKSSPEITKVGLLDRFEWILKPKPAAFTLVGVALVFFLLLPIINDNNGLEKVLYEEEKLNTSEVVYDMLDLEQKFPTSPNWTMRSDDSLGVSILIKDNNLIVTQEEMVKRQLMVTGATGTPIYINKYFDDKLNVFQSLDLSGEIVISIYHNDELLLNERINIEKK